MARLQVHLLAKCVTRSGVYPPNLISSYVPTYSPMLRKSMLYDRVSARLSTASIR